MATRALEEPVDESSAMPSRPRQSLQAKLRSSLLRGGFWVITGRLVAIISNVLTNAVLARFLAPADLGVFFILRNVWALGGIFAMFGLDAVLVRTVGESLGAGNIARARQALWFSISIALICMIVAGSGTVFVLVWWGKRLSGLPDGLLLPMLSGASVMLLGSTQLLAETHRSLNNLKVASFLSGQAGGAVTSVVCLAIFVAVATCWQANLVVAVVANCFAFLVATVIALLTIRRSMRVEFCAIEAQIPPTIALQAPALNLSTYVATCASVLVMQLLSYVIAQSDQLIGGLAIAASNSSFTLDEAGFYGAARRIVLLLALPMDLLNLTIAATVPRLYARREMADLQMLLQRTTRLAVLPTLAALLVLLVVPGPFVKIYFGSQFGPAAILVVILCTGILVQSLCGACEIVLVMTGNQGIVLRINAVLALLFVPCAYFTAVRFGATGLAAVASGALMMQRILLWYFAYRKLGVWTNFSMPRNFRELLSDFRPAN